MTESKTKEDNNFTISIGEPAYTLDETNMSGTYSVDLADIGWDTTETITLNTNPTYEYNVFNIDPDQVEDMCQHYPGLEKVWRNFKSVYDMCIQDYKGKLKEDGLDDDIPF